MMGGRGKKKDLVDASKSQQKLHETETHFKWLKLKRLKAA
jgi:hypothetical protein